MSIRGRCGTTAAWVRMDHIWRLYPRSGIEAGGSTIVGMAEVGVCLRRDIDVR